MKAQPWIMLASLLTLIGTGWLYALAEQAPTATPPASATLSQPTPPSHAVILLYHHVDTATPAITSISPEHFQQQLDYLASQQFQVWPLEQIVSRLKNRQPIPDKVVAITFDDSYQSIYTTAYPMLRQRGWPFTIFVSTDAIDQRYNLQTSWEQLREMAANGATIANHSSTHQHLLKKLPGENQQRWRERIEKDIEHAEQRIADEIGYSKKLFAYPYGEYNKALSQWLSELGYTAFGQHSGPVGEHADFSTLPRFPFAGDYTAIDEFALKVLTVPLAVTKVSAPDNPLPHATARPPLTLELEQAPASQAALQCFASLQGATTLNWQSANRFKVLPTQAIPAGRSRYNCTALFSRGAEADRYYWYSHPWIRLDRNEQWILD